MNEQQIEHIQQVLAELDEGPVSIHLIVLISLLITGLVASFFDVWGGAFMLVIGVFVANDYARLKSKRARYQRKLEDLRREISE